ncbi:MAG: PIN domain-containing protein [Treponema sp.]|nr:PIN domain-containing protein [Treponema sp.]
MEFLAEVTVIPLDTSVETATIKLRQANPKIKLPDAIIAATAIVLKATVISSDPHLLNLPSPGFPVQSLY